MKSFLAKKGQVEQKWWVLDAEGKVLGRLASKVAMILMGKNKPIYTPHVDTGDYVIVVNAEKVRLTGRKPQNKTYQTYSRYPSGQKIIPFARMIERHPEQVIERAVRRMLPKSGLGEKMFNKLKVYKGPHHEHAAQKPVKLEL
ncbi:MAG TPA: 50S ribosomal protein L13 [Anaerohalosphaeraceae bacterium]|jgi:large subunit ribosomal protein L13|nr:50S ribosomal protein L13 [Phycisphaerae bacterium]HOT72725.1 50S ribosomal protein L13 [Anaerohalosphaeraceae bacterium]HQG04883.1 50S ribosomal protein L13 [Anaerohalosphaeraceae bacterium]HQI07418.1 50S ribosomal protein L13 [Anaerohalosphaeraceae bacterium]HQJ67682.1 50S ribosomal protein L13 [Anaerohalosphaeraceae bacterium]